MSEIRLESLPDEDEYWVYRFGDLTFRTDSLDTRQIDRVIPLGGAAGIIMSYLARNPHLVTDKHVYEPFCGSGPLGIVAANLGAKQVNCVDINPKAIAYLKHNLERNSIDASMVASHLADVADFNLEQAPDWILANPPFVPTPTGVTGVLHSEAGHDGNRLASRLISRMREQLLPDGQALISTFQIEAHGEPLLARICGDHLPDRRVEFTKGSQYQGLPFASFLEGYRRRLPDMHEQLDRWLQELESEFGADLTVDNYIVHVGPEGMDPGVAIRSYDGTKYGDGFFRPRESARSVAFENLLSQ